MRPPPPPLPGVHHHDEELVGDWLNEIGQSALAADPSPAAGEAVDQQYVQVQVPVSELDEALQVLTIEEVLATVGLDDTTWPPLPARAPAPARAPTPAPAHAPAPPSAQQQAHDEGLVLLTRGNSSGYANVTLRADATVRGRTMPFVATLGSKNLGRFSTAEEAALCVARERARLQVQKQAQYDTALRVAEPAPVPVLPRASSSGSNSTDEPGLGSGRRVGAKVRAHPWLSPHP